MQYIHIVNWGKHQHYTKRNPPWIKLERDIIREFDEDGNPKKFFTLPDSAKLTFVLLLCFRPSFNKHIPLKSEKWLAEQLGIKKVDLQPLVDIGFITIAPDTLAGVLAGVLAEVGQDDNKVLAPETETETETETYGEFGNVKLSNEELQKLKEKFTEKGAKERIEALSEYMSSKGKQYKSHYATILSWERRKGPEEKGRKDTGTVCRSCGKDADLIIDGRCPKCREGRDSMPSTEEWKKTR